MTFAISLACWAVLWLILAVAFYVGGRLAAPPRNRPVKAPLSAATPVPHYHPYPTPNNAVAPR